MELDIVALSRLQFAVTALYHFLFVPLTIGLSVVIASIEAMWETEPAPAPFTAIGFPNQETRETHFAVKIPWVMGLIGTRSLNTEIPGINDLVEQAKTRIRDGIKAYDALMQIRATGKGAELPDEVRGAFAELGRPIRG